MHGSERRRLILEHAAKHLSIETQALADELGVSMMTIRRDIKRLEQEGFIRQTYGGGTVQLTRSIELGFNSRSLQFTAQKRLIGTRAAEFIEPGWTIFLGVGTTTAQLAQFLPAAHELLVITSSLSHASLLSSRKMRVIVIGGELEANDLAMCGPIAEETVRRFYVDLCVLGAAGVDSEVGLTEPQYQVASLHRLMIEHAQRVMVLADHSKFGRREAAIVAPLDRVHRLVTDSAGQSYFATQEHGPEIIYADVGGEMRRAQPFDSTP